MTGSSQKRFAILTKIVNYMKERHLRGEDHPLTIEEILDETNQLDIGLSTKTVKISEKGAGTHWLMNRNFFSGCTQKLYQTIQSWSILKVGSNSSQCLG